MKVKSLSHVRLLATPWTAAHQAPPSIGFFRQEYWSGLTFPSLGDLPDPGIKLGSPALQAVSSPYEPEILFMCKCIFIFVYKYKFVRNCLLYQNPLNNRLPSLSGGEGNGTPLQYSCLENPMDGGAWWAAVHGVAKSRT